MAKQVGSDLSKISTLFSISRTMAAFDSSKSVSSSLVQVNENSDFSASRNGSVCSAKANAYET